MSFATPPEAAILPHVKGKLATKPARMYDALRTCSFVAFHQNASPVEERETEGAFVP